jgi:hypothetical protein
MGSHAGIGVLPTKGYVEIMEPYRLEQGLGLAVRGNGVLARAVPADALVVTGS